MGTHVLGLLRRMIPDWSHYLADGRPYATQTNMNMGSMRMGERKTVKFRPSFRVNQNGKELEIPG
jgi:hypothetical protein